MSFWALKRQPGLETAESQDKNIQFSNMYIWGCGRKCGWFDIYCQKKLLKCVLLSERKERSHPWWRLSSFSLPSRNLWSNTLRQWQLQLVGPQFSEKYKTKPSVHSNKSTMSISSDIIRKFGRNYLKIHRNKLRLCQSWWPLRQCFYLNFYWAEERFPKWKKKIWPVLFGMNSDINFIMHPIFCVTKTEFLVHSNHLINPR